MGEMSVVHRLGGVIAVGSYRVRPSTQPGDDHWDVVDGDDHAIGYLDVADGAIHLYDERDWRAFEAAVLAALPAPPAGAAVTGSPPPSDR